MRDSVRDRIGRLERRGKNIAVEDCPICQEKALLVIVEDNGEKNYDINATRRKDSKTYICSDCGKLEALLGIERVYE
jgi:rubrerythrin